MRRRAGGGTAGRPTAVRVAPGANSILAHWRTAHRPADTRLEIPTLQHPTESEH